MKLEEWWDAPDEVVSEVQRRKSERVKPGSGVDLGFGVSGFGIGQSMEVGAKH